MLEDVVGGDAIVAGEGEVLRPALDGLDELFLELTRQEHVAHESLHHVTAGVGDLFGAVEHGAAVIYGVGLAVIREAALFACDGLEDRLLEGEGELRVGRGGAHGVVGGQRHGCVLAVHEDFVELIAQLLVAVGDAARLEGLVIALEGQGELGASDRREVRFVLGDVAQLLVLHDGGILLVLLVVAIEELVLTVGADDAADEREDEHEGQDDQARDGDAVAEEPLDHECGGREGLDATVVVQGVLGLLGACALGVDLLRDEFGDLVFLGFVCHVSRPLMRYGRVGRPRRRGCRK